MTKEQLKKEVAEQIGCSRKSINIDALIQRLVVTSMRDVKEVIFKKLYGYNRYEIEALYYSDTFSTEQVIVNDFID